MRNSTKLSIMTDSIELELVLIESSMFITSSRQNEFKEIHLSDDR